MLPLKINQEELGNGKILLRLVGPTDETTCRIDTTTSHLLHKKLESLIKLKNTHILLDFSLVEKLSSAGLRVLLQHTKNISEKGGHLVLFALNEEIAGLIDMAHFHTVLTICSSEREAKQV